MIGLLLLCPALSEAKFYIPENLPERPAFFQRAYDAASRLDEMNGNGDHCSAVPLSQDGYVLTNLHCVRQCLKLAGVENSVLETSSGAHYSITRTRVQEPDNITCVNLMWDDSYGQTRINGRIVWLGRGTLTFSDIDIGAIPEDIIRELSSNQDDFAVLKFETDRPNACVPAAEAAPGPGEKVWNIGYPAFTARHDGFDSTGYKKHIGFGTVTGDLRTDLYLSANITTEEQWRKLAGAYDGVLMATTDSMSGSSGSMLINGAGELVGLHYSQTSPSSLRYDKDLGSNALAIRMADIIAELKAGLGAERTKKIFSCPR